MDSNSTAAAAQTSSTTGAAERAGKGWPYPEPAQPGATGFSPDYSAYRRQSEHWDIYVHILWRKMGSRIKRDLEYYDQELVQFLMSVEGEERAKLENDHVLLMIEQIRSKTLKLPYRDPVTGCLLFMVKHDDRMDLAANDCEAKS